MTWPTLSVGARFNKASFTWTEIGDYCERIQIRSGRQRFLERYAPGAITLELDNSDRRFDPLNLSGPYVSGGVTQVEPMVQLLVLATHSGTDYALKIAFADSWDTVGAVGEALCVVQATDGFKVLAVADPPVSSVAAGTRVGAAIASMVPSTSYISTNGIDTVSSTSTRQPSIGLLEVGSSKSLELMQSLADTDRGDLFMAPAYIGGRWVDDVKFRHYYRRQTSTSRATWSDDPGVGEFLYESVRPLGTNDDAFCSKVVAQRSGGAQVTATSTTAKTANMGVDRARSGSSLLHEDDDQVTAWAEGVLYRFQAFETGFSSMKVDLAAQDSAALWAEVLSMQIGDRITVEHTPPGGGSAISRDHFIEGINHDIVLPQRQAEGWTVTFTLSDASRFFTDVFLLDSVTQGVLDTNRLGF